MYYDKIFFKLDLMLYILFDLLFVRMIINYMYYVIIEIGSDVVINN